MKNTHRTLDRIFSIHWALVIGVLATCCSMRAAEGRATGSKEPSEAMANLLARGALAEERGRVTTALEYYREAVQAFDRQRPLMAQALLRLGKSYEMIGASESAEAAYQRLARDYSDQPALLENVPHAYRQSASMPNVGLTDPTQRSLGAMTPPSFLPQESRRVEIDLENEERQIILETARRRLEKARAHVETAHDEVLREEIRLRLVGDSSPMSLPASVNPGPDYDAFRAAWRQARMTMKEEGPMLKKIEAQTKDWIDEVFLPSLRTSFEGANRVYKEFQMRYDEEFDSYRDLLRQYRDVEQAKREREKAIAEEERQLAEQQLRIEEEEARKVLEEKERRKIRFVMLGNVRSPGFYEVPENVEIDLLQAIAMAGGFSDNADKRKVKIKRGENVQEVSVTKLMQKPKAGQFHLISGDTVIVGEELF